MDALCSSHSRYTVCYGHVDVPSCNTAPMNLDRPARDEARQIARELSSLARSGRVLPGSIQQRLMRCGRAGCACRGDPPRPHGPYWQWTRKVAGKTVTRYLSAEEAADYESWVKTDRRIRELLARLEAIAIGHVEGSRRSS